MMSYVFKNMAGLYLPLSAKRYRKQVKAVEVIVNVSITEVKDG